MVAHCFIELAWGVGWVSRGIADDIDDMEMVMKLTTQRAGQIKHILLALVLSFSSFPVLALSLGLDVKAGIDSETLRFLESYPENVRKEAVLGASQVLDRADVSVSKIFMQGRELIFLVTDGAVCIQRNLKAVPRGVFERMFGLYTVYSREVDGALNKLANSARLNTTPSDFVKGYVVVDVIASDGQCLTMQSDLDQRELIKQRGVINTSYILWQRLGDICKSLGECYSLVRTTVESELSNALQQDKDRVKADERMARISQPPEPRQTKLPKNYGLFHYERAINGMLEIHDDLIRVREVRLAKGLAVKSELDKALASVFDSLKKAESTKDWAASCNQGYKLAHQFTTIANLQEGLAGFELLSKQEMDDLKSSISLAADRQKKLVSRKSSSNGFRNDGKSCWWLTPAFDKDTICTSVSC